jgi:uncharacterized protein YecE (DUF72 family)
MGRLKPQRAEHGSGPVARYRVGCSGWSYEDWVGVFYPAGAAAGEFLERYARVFDVTEVDSSFYRPPTEFLTRRWAAVTPKGFLFALKIPREITHEPLTAELPDRVRHFLSVLRPLREDAKLGPLVAQFPPSFRRSNGAARLEQLLAEIPPEYELAVELRHNSWWVPETFSALEARRAALVWSVFPGVRNTYRRTGDFLYARFIGDRALTRFDRIQRDGRADMECMKAHFEQEGGSARTVLSFVNNHFMGFGPGTARILQGVLGVPAADLSRAGTEPGQRGLEEFGE